MKCGYNIRHSYKTDTSYKIVCECMCAGACIYKACNASLLQTSASLLSLHIPILGFTEDSRWLQWSKKGEWDWQDMYHAHVELRNAYKILTW